MKNAIISGALMTGLMLIPMMMLWGGLMEFAHCPRSVALGSILVDSIGLGVIDFLFTLARKN